ncbi:RNA polymerase sigma factor [Sunxiuqinia indica]|uniref:RNA polymerase sigma factor n=1 Tax=Sunxiuqinia indica TaxID=2692584 RepID=UPI001359FCA1|nr:sigma-70 family RNA polymerase sigma factor [Sunxiuqinia indica]
MVEEDLKPLINGCRKRDRQSQKMVYQKLYGFSMKICLRFAKKQVEAAEIVNDGFFKAFTNIDKYDENWSFKTWLSRIMHNASIDYYRANLKWSQMETLDQSEFFRHEASVERKLGYEDLLETIRQLPPAYRMVFNLYAIDGYTHEEIANMTGITAGTSRSNLYKARQKLQQMLARPQSIIALLLWTLWRKPIRVSAYRSNFYSNAK